MADLDWRPTKLATLGAVALCLAASGSLCAQEDDVVYFAHPRLRGETRIVGQVVEYKGKSLEIRIDGEVRTVAAERVRRIEFRKHAQHVEGDKLFAAHDFAEARNRYLKARLAEPRAWVQRLLMAQTVWCDRHLGQFEGAGTRFLDLLAEDPETPYFEALPIAWLSSPLTPALEAKATAWLASNQPVPQLLGASHLVLSRHRSAAMDKLQTLRFHRDTRIAGLAKAQLWRAELATASSAQVAQWQIEAEKIPEPFRAGAYYVIGSALARHKQPEEAALTLLRVPVLYPEDRNLAARCLADAAALLKGLGRTDEAAHLERELATRYAETRDATEAASSQKR